MLNTTIRLNIRKRRRIARQSRFEARDGPVPGQQLVETICGETIGHALQDVLEIGVRLDVVELRGGDERADSGPSLAAAIGTGKEMVLAAKCYGPDGPFD